MFEPDLGDTDGDGLTAFLELTVYGTDPTKADTDGDGLSDSTELNATETIYPGTDLRMIFKSASSQARLAATRGQAF